MLKNCKKYNMSIAVNTLFMKRKINRIINIPLCCILFLAAILSGPSSFSKTLKSASIFGGPGNKQPLAISFSGITSITACTGAVAVYTSTAPIIDGAVDAVWSQAPSNAISQTISGTIQTGSTWQALYNATNLYILVQVKDANLSNVGTNVYDQDGVEVFISANNNKSTGGFSSTDHQYRFDWNEPTTTANISGTTNGTTGITYAIPTSTGGYTLEVSIPWSTIGQTSTASGQAVGFDININDQQNNSGPRDAQAGWNSTSAYDYTSPSLFGTISLCVNAPVVSVPATINATVGTAFSYTISASNAPTSYAVTNLPAGLSVNTSTGIISGTPTATGTFTDTLKATNTVGTGTQVLIITVGAGGISSLNGLTGTSQTFAIDSSGSNFAITSSGTTHTFIIPTASASKRGLLSASDWNNFNNRGSGTVTSITSGYGLTGSAITTTGTLTVDTAALSLKYLRRSDSLAAYATFISLSDTAASLRNALNSSSSSQTFVTGTTGSDFTITSSGTTHTFNLPTADATNRGALSSSDWNTFYSKPSLSGTINYVAKITGSNTIGNSLIFDNGTSVGIGTTGISDPTYKLFVETGIRTRKVKIDQLTWSDFVFDNDYELLSLADVEKYIQQNKHLPGVPSAEEIKNNGADIGETQAMLLKKVEELTLYLIDLNKKVDALSKENKLLKKKIKKHQKIKH